MKTQKKFKIVVYLWGLNVLSLVKQHQFASNFEHWNVASNEAYFGNKFSIQIIVLCLWFFKDTKLQF